MAIDVQSKGPVESHKIITERVSQSSREAVILIGHGNSEGSKFEGLRANGIFDDLIPLVTWFHACNCGKSIIFQVSKFGVRAIGYVCNILFTGVDDEILRGVKTALEALPKDTNCSEILRSIREGWYRLAVKYLHARDLLRASVVNHTRLNIGCSES